MLKSLPLIIFHKIWKQNRHHVLQLDLTLRLHWALATLMRRESKTGDCILWFIAHEDSKIWHLKWQNHQPCGDAFPGKCPVVPLPSRACLYFSKDLCFFAIFCLLAFLSWIARAWLVLNFPPNESWETLPCLWQHFLSKTPQHMNQWTEMPQPWEEINSKLFIFIIQVFGGFHGDSLASNIFSYQMSYCATIHLS